MLLQVLPVTILLNHCSLRLPKKPRPGHEFAFRLNIDSGKTTGKLIIDPVRLGVHLSTCVDAVSLNPSLRGNRAAAKLKSSGLMRCATPGSITASMVRDRCLALTGFVVFDSERNSD